MSKQASDWISVEDRLPSGSGYYLTYRLEAPQGNRVVTMLYSHHNNISWSGGYRVTHWMPLPAPPTEQGQSDE